LLAVFADTFPLAAVPALGPADAPAPALPADAPAPALAGAAALGEPAVDEPDDPAQADTATASVSAEAHSPDTSRDWLMGRPPVEGS
jgi:hypothetical protein